MNQLKEISDGIRDLESVAWAIERSIQQFHKTYRELYDLLSKPEYTDGTRYLDYGEHPNGDGIKFEFVPLSRYDPFFEKWGGREWSGRLMVFVVRQTHLCMETMTIQNRRLKKQGRWQKNHQTNRFLMTSSRNKKGQHNDRG